MNRGGPSRPPDDRELLGRLARGVEAPDLSASILAEVDRQRPFATGTARRRVAWWRSTPAVVTLALLGAVVVLQRTAPDTLPRSGPPPVVSAVVEAGRDEAQAGAAKFSAAVDHAARDLLRGLAPTPAPVAAVVQPRAAQAGTDLRWDVSAVGLVTPGSGGVMVTAPTPALAHAAPAITPIAAPAAPWVAPPKPLDLAARWCWCGSTPHRLGCGLGERPDQTLPAPRR